MKRHRRSMTPDEVRQRTIDDEHRRGCTCSPIVTPYAIGERFGRVVWSARVEHEAHCTFGDP